MPDTVWVPPKTIYVRPADEALFERAEHWAVRHRLSLSALIATALDAYLAAHGDDPEEKP